MIFPTVMVSWMLFSDGAAIKNVAMVQLKRMHNRLHSHLVQEPSQMEFNATTDALWDSHLLGLSHLLEAKIVL